MKLTCSVSRSFRSSTAMLSVCWCSISFRRSCTSHQYTRLMSSTHQMLVRINRSPLANQAAPSLELAMLTYPKPQTPVQTW